MNVPRLLDAPIRRGIAVVGLTATASITNESAEELGLANGKNATVIIKASNVMVGVD